MHGVNLDLLRCGPHHPDGQPKNPHDHHRTEHVAALRAARRARWQAALTRAVHLMRILRRRPGKVRSTCP